MSFTIHYFKSPVNKNEQFVKANFTCYQTKKLLGRNSSLICGYLYSNSVPWKEGNFPDTIQDILTYCINIICTISADWHNN